jgi:hypothetical protein
MATKRSSGSAKMSADQTIEFFLELTPKPGQKSLFKSAMDDFKSKLERCGDVKVTQIGEPTSSVGSNASKFNHCQFYVQITNDACAIDSIDSVVTLLRALLSQGRIEAVKISIGLEWAEYPSTENNQPEQFLKQANALLKGKLKKRIALLIASDQYRNSNLPALKKVQQDVVQMRKVLRDSCGFEISEPIINATAKEIRKAIRDFYNQARVGDFTLLYFSGYVHWDHKDKDLYFVANDTDTTDLINDAISANLIKAREKVSGASHLVIVDGYSVEALTANNNAFSEQKIVEYFKDSTTAVLAFVEPKQNSSQISGGTSPFTTHLINGIKTLANSKNNVTLKEVYNYALGKLGKKEVQSCPPIENLPWFVKALPKQVAPPPKIISTRTTGSGSSSPQPGGGWLGPLVFVIGAFILFYILFGNQLSCSLTTGKDMDTPLGFVRSHYQFLTQGCYQKAWNMYSPGFQTKSATFEVYKSFWSEYSEINIKKLEFFGKPTDTRAMLTADISYKYKDGREDHKDTDLRICLSRNSKNGSWVCQNSEEDGQDCFASK